MPRLTKAEVLRYWKKLPDNQPFRSRKVPYKHTGSTYDQDGIRITGSREFIDSVLSHLKELLSYEDVDSRLSVNYQQSTDRETRTPLDSWNCYIQVHERGFEGQIMAEIEKNGLRAGMARVHAQAGALL